MCSYIGFTLHSKYNFELKKLMENFIDELDVKGGDEYGAIIEYDGFTKRLKTLKELKDFEFKNTQIIKKLNIILFSRQAPEMESEAGNRNLQQPYINPRGDIIACHGTIPNAEKYKNFNVLTDTDIFNYEDYIQEVIYYTQEQGGKISLLYFDNENQKFKWFDNGLGVYKYKYQEIEIYTNLIFNSNIFKNKEKLNSFEFHKPVKRKITFKNGAIALFSGGMDITCSVQKYLTDTYLLEDFNLELLYFDWGTRATKQEIEAGQRFVNYLKEKYKDDQLNITHKVIEVKDMFKNILTACNLQTTRLIDENAIGAGSHEAEAAISYVPFRNQFLITLAAAYAEQKYKDCNMDIILGGNLSEGMVYLDNSETFLRSINDTIKVGGQNSFMFNVVAPYINKTKTYIIKDAIKNKFNLETVYSCYFPKEDGSECGECGSCLLKQKAMERGSK